MTEIYVKKRETYTAALRNLENRLKATPFSQFFLDTSLPKKDFYYLYLIQLEFNSNLFLSIF